jgi:uridine phosphorylase
MKPLEPSELIVSENGAIYHLDLRPDQIGQTIFLVGDPDRVPKVSRYFDNVEHKVQKREFVTHTGSLGNKRLTVISTGIGTDNIDIVINEMDALVNIDFETRTIKEKLTSLEFIRLGTSGSLSSALPPDTHVLSTYGIGLDNLLYYYKFQPNESEIRLRESFTAFNAGLDIKLTPFATQGNSEMIKKLENGLVKGITLTCPGFYGPQGRVLRTTSIMNHRFFENIQGFEFDGYRVTNFEMETSAIFGLTRMLGHKGASCNTILANRVTNQFTSNYHGAMDALIRNVLEKISASK